MINLVLTPSGEIKRLEVRKYAIILVDLRNLENVTLLLNRSPNLTCGRRDFYLQHLNGIDAFCTL